MKPLTIKTHKTTLQGGGTVETDCSDLQVDDINMNDQNEYQLETANLQDSLASVLYSN